LEQKKCVETFFFLSSKYSLRFKVIAQQKSSLKNTVIKAEFSILGLVQVFHSPIFLFPKAFRGLAHV
jgi:hypothetical protein